MVLVKTKVIKMNSVVLLFFIAFASNVAIAKEISSSVNILPMTVNDHVQQIIRQQLSNISIKGDARDWFFAPAYSDEINFETQQVDLCGPILCISANITKGSIIGVTEYELIKSEFNSNGTTVTIDIDINFPKLQLNADHYTMKGNIMEALPLSGEGKLHFETTDLRIWTKIILQVSDHTSIEGFENSGFSINSISSHTEFDGNIDDVFNAMVGELLVDHLNRFNKAIAAQCGAVLKQLLNPILN